jgi:hypothetical protein
MARVKSVEVGGALRCLCTMSDRQGNQIYRGETVEIIFKTRNTVHVQDQRGVVHKGKVMNWKQYTAEELAAWVHLLTKRASYSNDAPRVAKDLDDAGRYLDMLILHGIHIFTVFGNVYTTATLRKNLDDTRYKRLLGDNGLASLPRPPRDPKAA